MVLQEIEPFPIQEILQYNRYNNSSWHFSTPTEKPAEVSSHEHALFLQGKFLRFMCHHVFFQNCGGVLSMFFCLWVSAVLAGARCCRMSGLTVTGGTAVGTPMSLSKKLLSCRCKKDMASAQTAVPEHLPRVLFPPGYTQDAAKELVNPWREGHSFRIRFWICGALVNWSWTWWVFNFCF